jgi:hypothetical protein
VNERFGEVVTWLAVQTLVSRAAVFLSYLRLQHFRSLSRVVCKFLSPQLCKISKMSSSSAKSAFDFLRLRASWLRLWPRRVLIFWKLWRHKQNFVLALKVLPQFPSDRRASFKS